MRTLIVTHYFPPEIGAPQARLSELAAAWADAGDEVVVLTGMPNHPTGVVPPEYRRRLKAREQVDGYRVERRWVYATPNEGFVKKILGHLSFMVTSLFLGRRTTGPLDVVIVSSPTFFAIFSAWIHAKRYRARFVVEVRDLWPGIFVELGVLTNRWIIAALERLELTAYRAADLVIVVSDGFRDHIAARGIPSGKIHTIRNGVDLERFHPTSGDRSDARATLGAEATDTLVLYLGGHGISHGLDAVLGAAAQLRDSRLRFAFVGEGAAKAALVAKTRELGLEHVRFLPGVPRDEVPDLLAAADICLVPLRDVPLFQTFIPSKIFEYLGAGKAVVGAVRGEPADILQEGGAIVVPPQDASALAEALEALANDPPQRECMGKQGYEYVCEHFDRRQLADQYRQLLTDLVLRAGASR